MFSVLVLCLTLSNVRGYTIKVHGNIEMGKEVAKVLEQIRDTINTNGGADTVQKFLSSLTEGEPNTDQAGSDFKWKPMEQKSDLSLARESPFLNKKTKGVSPYEMKGDMALLDEMVNLNEEEAHVYGRHKQSVRQYPMNQIKV